MVNVQFTEDEVIEIANHTAFTAFHALEDDDDDAWHTARIAISILDKIEAAYPALMESENLLCAREMTVVRHRVAGKAKT